MRLLNWIAGAAVTAASIATGCSSSSSGGGAPDSSTSSTPDTGTVEDAGCAIDADFSFVTASDASSPCGVCLVTMCQTAIHQCETDCLCGGYFTCVAENVDAGANAFVICLGDAAATLATNPAILALSSCYTTTCGSTCLPKDAAVGD